jgi:hypothetical protein
MKTETVIVAHYLTWIRLSLKTESGSADSGEGAEQSETFHTDIFGVARDRAISLQTLVCDIKTESGTKQVVVLLDSGSNSSLIDQDLASKLKAEVRVCPIVKKVN